MLYPHFPHSLSFNFKTRKVVTWTNFDSPSTRSLALALLLTSLHHFPHSIVERHPRPLNYVAVGTSTPAGDDYIVNSIPRDDDWSSTSPTQLIFDDKHEPGHVRSDLSIVTSSTRSDTSSWDEISSDEEDSFEDVYHDWASQPTSPVSPTPISPPSMPTSSYRPTWTNEIPLELIEAAREERAYLTCALREQRETQTSTETAITLPRVPLPPELSRYLDKPVISPSLQKHAARRNSMPAQAPNRLDFQQGFSASGKGARPGVATVSVDVDVGPDERSLPIPTHAVIQHLCTSAIKGGVLGVAVTHRYKSKFPTAIYYKCV
ncbi:5 ampactivated protein kinase subunit beta [Moniliophthora roreri MCA 2997]|uniref:5 ampactivated protein kinase subunit beta n=2 Tax=Moniliophthora roreri TaxID=221103 RepID=V2X9R7_MONRO|nr:5 ampactivated protein kinase subunit beta [Moniliophthora roreri MCA 2997]